MFKISRICRNLEELGLRDCQLITNKGFSHLENLELLERLDLYGTCIETRTLCTILQRNPRMRHLRLGGMMKLDHPNLLQMDEIAMELRNSCPDLESINLWLPYALTSQGINALADCKNLREIEFEDNWNCGTMIGHGDIDFRTNLHCYLLNFPESRETPVEDSLEESRQSCSVN